MEDKRVKVIIKDPESEDRYVTMTEQEYSICSRLQSMGYIVDGISFIKVDSFEFTPFFN